MEPAGALESWTEPAGALESWTEPAGALESWTEPAGALESWTDPAGALEGAGEEQAWEDAGEEQAPEGAGEERALENLKPPQGWTGPAGMTERGEGASRTPAQSPSQLNPPPCPAVPDVLSAPAPPPPRCRGRSSTPHSHRPRQAPSWWALSPALAPDLTGWAIRDDHPGRSSAQSLGFALARRSRREMALRHRWARADAPYRGEMVGWALEWIWRDHPLGKL